MFGRLELGWLGTTHSSRDPAPPQLKSVVGRERGEGGREHYEKLNLCHCCYLQRRCQVHLVNIRFGTFHVVKCPYHHVRWFSDVKDFICGFLDWNTLRLKTIYHRHGPYGESWIRDCSHTVWPIPTRRLFNGEADFSAAWAIQWVFKWNFFSCGGQLMSFYSSSEQHNTVCRFEQLKSSKGYEPNLLHICTHANASCSQMPIITHHYEWPQVPYCRETSNVGRRQAGKRASLVYHVQK